ncbi:MAG: hypothetical protein EAX89_11170 [Candidatus Lokiarchaeota archaeon]|nr:hypothetical protein [Candidatus Lokiarchaeota archaeon]
MNVKTILGKPDFIPGKFLGYVLWKQSDGFHLRWTIKGKKRQSFQGKIKCLDKIKIINVYRTENTYKVNETQKNTIEWNTVLDSELDGFDFLTPGDFEVELRIKNKMIKSKMIFLGSEMFRPENNPFKIIQSPSELILGDESEIIDTKVKLEKDEKEIVFKEPEPVYESEPTHKPKQVIEQNSEESSTFEPAPLPIPAPEYDETTELTPTTIIDETPQEESEMVVSSSEMSEVIAKEEVMAETEVYLEPSLETIPEIEITPEKRIYEWLTQLLTYRDFGLKDEPKLVSIAKSLPETAPEINIESDTKLKIEEVSPLMSKALEQSDVHLAPKVIPEVKPPEDESKSILIYESLPESAPEIPKEPISKPENEEQFILSAESVKSVEIPQTAESVLESESKSEDKMEARIGAWLAQLLKYRKFKTE